MNTNYVWIAITIVAFAGGLEVGYAYYLTNDPYSALTRDPEAMNRFANQLSGSMMNSPSHQKMMKEMMSGSNMGSMDGMGMNGSGMDHDNMGMENMHTDSGTTTGFNQTAMLERGNTAMGFDQTKIMHHFMATATGGQIMIMALDMNDVKTINEIKSHVKDIQHEFSQGDFAKPFYIHGQIVPGAQVMTDKKDHIQYTIKNTEDGAVLVLTTKDAELLDAIHQFMDYQSSQHIGH